MKSDLVLVGGAGLGHPGLVRRLGPGEDEPEASVLPRALHHLLLLDGLHPRRRLAPKLLQQPGIFIFLKSKN